MGTHMNYLTSREVADMLRISVMSVSRLYTQGCFPNAIKTSPAKNAALRIPSADVDAYIETQKQRIAAASS